MMLERLMVPKIKYLYVLLLALTPYQMLASDVSSDSKTLVEQVHEEQGDQLSIEEKTDRRGPPHLINGAFGLGKNFHAFRVGYAFSPLAMPKGWDRWDFYLEFAFYILHRRIYSPRRLYIGTITPFFRFHFDPSCFFDPYWDIGVGGAYRDKTKFGNIQISTNLAFHILTSFGFYPFGTKGPSLSFRWYHFSNAKIKTPNNGIDIHANVALEYPF